MGLYDDEDDFDSAAEEEFMEDSREELASAVVGRRIVKAVYNKGSIYTGDTSLVLTLDNGTVVTARGFGDCCAGVNIQQIFFSDPSKYDHVITAVTAEEGYERWFILAGDEKLLGFDVGWTAGNFPYYSYGIQVEVLNED